MGEVIIPIDLFIPEKTELAAVLQNELSTDFEEVTVEWVDCPDLTEKPFNLAAPGLCGDTALFDIGGISNLFPLPKKEKKFYFKTILQQLNRTKSDNFIIGGGLCERSDKMTDLGELIMNASFSPTTNKTMTVRNKSRLAFLKKFKRSKNQKRMLSSLLNIDPKCHIYGNFFVSNGQREQVLKVQAKNCIGRDFIVALQHAISRFSSGVHSQLIGFGGAFIVKNGKTLHHVIRNNWSGPATERSEICERIEYWNVKTPVVAFATFVNADRHVVNMNPGLKEIFLTPWHAHSYSIYGGGHYHKTKPNENNDTTEYLGYFSPATKLYRIDPVPMFYEMPNFSYLRNH